ncbi:MAG: thioesterase family protein [Clostridia bacterium]|nr:thioesterase family protein [Clostridia bacterium]
MDYNLKIGMKAEIEQEVMQEHTAMAFGSGGVKVLATPMMIGLMEKAALTAVDDNLGEGFSTVGTIVNVSHMAATPVGMKVRAVAKLTNIEGRKLTFDIEAFDEKEKIGEGTHERYIIELAKFLRRVEGKATKV